MSGVNSVKSSSGNADMELWFGVLGEDSISVGSGKLILDQLTSIINSINKNPLKIKLAIDVISEKANILNSINSSIGGSKNTEVSIDVSKINISKTALNDFKKQLSAVVNTIDLGSNTSITLSSEDIGDITSKAKETATAIDSSVLKAAEFTAQMKLLDVEAKKVEKSFKDINVNDFTTEELKQLNSIDLAYKDWMANIQALKSSQTSLSDSGLESMVNNGRALIGIMSDLISSSAKVAQENEKIAEASRLAKEEQERLAKEKSDADRKSVEDAEKLRLKTAEVSAQMKLLDIEVKKVEKGLKGISDSDFTEDEQRELNAINLLYKDWIANIQKLKSSQTPLSDSGLEAMINDGRMLTVVLNDLISGSAKVVAENAKIAQASKLAAEEQERATIQEAEANKKAIEDAEQKNIKAAEYAIQMKRISESVSNLSTQFKKVDQSDFTDAEKSNLRELVDLYEQWLYIVEKVKIDTKSSKVLSIDVESDIIEEGNKIRATLADLTKATSLPSLQSSISGDLSKISENSTANELISIKQITEEYKNWIAKVEVLRSSKDNMSDEAYSNLIREGQAIKSVIADVMDNVRAAKLLEDAKQKEFAAQMKASEAEKTSYTEILKLYKQLTQYINSNTKLVGTGYGIELGDMKKELDDVIRGVSTLDKAKLHSLEQQFANVKSQVKLANKEGQTFVAMIAEAYQRFGGWMLVTRTLTSVWHVMRDMVSAVYELDTAMTELKKVTDETSQTYDNFLTNAISRSRELGASVSDIVTATADFARLGYSIGDASELADAAIVYKNVGDGIEDITEASESIISTMQAFGIEAENSMSIVDKFNATGNNFAISSSGVGEALLNSASALAAANNTFEESIAMITSANTTIQDPGKVGKCLCPTI